MTEPSASDTSQVSNQLPVLVPTFDPSTDNVEIWSSKVELLLHVWPPGKLLELVTRLILGCKGTAYQKLQLHQKELLVNDVASIKKLVELVGGTWGAIPLEKKFELVEKAFYKRSQKVDESSDSYLSRTDVIWTELLSKRVGLKEIRSHIILRGSRLNAEDKKRVIVESVAEKGGSLELNKVQAAIRMVGSGFFQEMTGAKRDKGLKTYDHTAFTVDEIGDDDAQETFWVQDEVLETLAAEDDEDAALILQFEDAISETIQNDSEMCAFYSSYQEARKGLSEKVRFRGFWAVKRGDKGFGKKGKSKGKGKGSLASRVANSYCRICMKRGHWKNECPNRNSSSNASSAASSTTVPTTFAVTDDVLAELIHMAIAEESWTNGDSQRGICGLRQVKGHDRNWGKRDRNKKYDDLKTRLRKLLTFDRVQQTLSGRSRAVFKASDDSQPASENGSDGEIPSYFATAGTTGVLDLGASQTVVGSEQVPELLANLPEWVRQRTRRCPCNLTFRFGNHQTLASRHALVLPLGQQTFRIAVVEGKTPCLISNTFLKGLKAVIDTEQETLYSRMLPRYLQLSKSHNNLFLMDIQQLWEPETRANLAAVQPSRPEHHSLVSENQNSESQEHQGPGYHMSTCQGITGNPSGSTCTDHVMNASDEKPVHEKPVDAADVQSESILDSKPAGSSHRAPCKSSENTRTCAQHGIDAEVESVLGHHRGDKCRGSFAGSSEDDTARTGKEVIQFGKAKIGQSFKQVFEDNKWTDWFVGAYENSTKIEHVKFVTYVSKRLDAEMAAKCKGYPKSSNIKTPNKPTETKSKIKNENSWETHPKQQLDEVNSEISEFIPINASPHTAMLEEQVTIVQEENHNLRGRMTQIEMALRELIQHVKNLNPNQ
jgi:hypothetical protein